MSWHCWSQNGLLLYAGGRVKNEHPVNTLRSTGPARELSRERVTLVLVISWVSDPIPFSYYAVACAMERGGGGGGGGVLPGKRTNELNEVGVWR